MFSYTPLCYKTRVKAKHFSKILSKSGSRILIAKPKCAAGENKSRAQKTNTYPAVNLPEYVVSFCARLFGGFTLHRWEAMYPGCSVTTKSFIRRFLGSFSCDNILANNRSLVNMFCNDFSSSRPRTHFGASEDCKLRTAKGAN